MKNILSIDIDVFWNSRDTIYLNKKKIVDPKFDTYLLELLKVNFDNIQIGLDHHEICQYLDLFEENYIIHNIDAHHDLYGDSFKLWLNPIYARGRQITIGNFFVQLLREKSLDQLNWIIPDIYDSSTCKVEILKNIGEYYSQKIEIIKLRDFIPMSFYDLVFISISPEWVPQKDLDHIIRILTAFKFEKDEITELVSLIKKRWSMGDNNQLIDKDRFVFQNCFK